MMLPSIEEIKNTISEPSNILIPKLNGYCPIPGILGPEQYPGGFSIVFPFTNGTDKKALRIWHREIPEIKRRTSQISNYLSQQHQLKYFIDYEYVSNAIKFESGIKIDAVLMDWGDGLTLKYYIDNLINSNINEQSKRDKLWDLARTFFEMFTELHEVRISHGDLQHGNILIKEPNNIKLIDYDSLYVPTMGPLVTQVTSGLSGYQHPSRCISRYSTERNDYFSELVIITSLIYLSEDLSVWEDFSIMADDYSLLFNSKDYCNFKTSKIYKRGILKSKTLHFLLDQINHALALSDIEKLNPIEDVISRAGIDLKIPNQSYYCIQCGTLFTAGDIYCIHCGTKRI